MDLAPAGGSVLPRTLRSPNVPVQRRTAKRTVRCNRVLGGIPSLTTMSLHLVTQFNHAALVGFDFGEMEGDVLVQLLEE